jgi:hypothetical protein
VQEGGLLMVLTLMLLREKVAHGGHRRGGWFAMRQSGLAQLDGEAIPVSELLKLALRDGHLQCLLLC